MTGDSSQDPADDGGFFGERKAAAVLKHGILRRYLPVFVTKTGTYSRDRMVVYFDGYAGRGRYEDGTPGSPLIAADVGRKVAAMRSPRELRMFLVEKNRAEADRLRRVMASEAQATRWIVRDGDAKNHIEELLIACREVPLFGLLDPYGRGLPVSSVVRLMNRPRDKLGRPQTELLINFSDPMVRRIGGLLTSSNPQPHDDVTLGRMDEVCGGSWWRAAYLESPSNASGVRAVVVGYRQRLEDAASCRTWCVPVRNRAHQEPRYFLILLSRHPDGLWEFGEAVSNATDEWRKFIAESTFGEDEPLFDWEAYLDDLWTNAITRNITALIDGGAAPFVVRDEYEAVMGDTLGQARGKQIRAAIKQLHTEGRTATDGKGDIGKMVIRPPTGR